MPESGVGGKKKTLNLNFMSLLTHFGSPTLHSQSIRGPQPPNNFRIYKSTNVRCRYFVEVGVAIFVVFMKGLVSDVGVNELCVGVFLSLFVFFCKANLQKNKSQHHFCFFSMMGEKQNGRFSCEGPSCPAQLRATTFWTQQHRKKSKALKGMKEEEREDAERYRPRVFGASDDVEARLALFGVGHAQRQAGQLH